MNKGWLFVVAVFVVIVTVNIVLAATHFHYCIPVGGAKFCQGYYQK